MIIRYYEGFTLQSGYDGTDFVDNRISIRVSKDGKAILKKFDNIPSNINTSLAMRLRIYKSIKEWLKKYSTPSE